MPDTTNAPAFGLDFQVIPNGLRSTVIHARQIAARHERLHKAAVARRAAAPKVLSKKQQKAAAAHARKIAAKKARHHRWLSKKADREQSHA